jgi:N-terminal domain of galactosyltransferase/N-terminal region of glycosyl transferase group 7
MNMPAAKRLHIVVPYRDREAHLRAFVPHLRAYFARDKLDRDISYSVTIVQQENGLPFNRGAVKNIGFLLDEASDYTCFHDIDYLPIWADYGWVDEPSGIVWYGAEERPVAPGRSSVAMRHRNLGDFFGGAFMVPNELFRQVNGYSNEYWGWGYEDADLVRRFTAADIRCGRRKGTFSPLDHDSDALDPTGKVKPLVDVNYELCIRKWSPGAPPTEDGLSTISYEVLGREKIPDPRPEREATYEMVMVRLNIRPSPSHLQAMADAKAKSS